MQMNGIRDSHSSEMHQVTKCMHDHTEKRQQGGGAKLSLGSSAVQTVQTEQEQQLSFFDWVRRLMQSGRRHLLGFWDGSGKAELESLKKDAEEKSVGERSPYAHNISDNSAINDGGILKGNPYFAAIEPEKPPARGIPILRKARLKVRAAAGRFAGYLPGHFFQSRKEGSFQAKKEGKQEDLRRRSKYREDRLEIDCVLTDDSYLLDSYDRKGGYSQLTTTK